MSSIYVRYKVETIIPKRYRYYEHRSDAVAFAQRLINLGHGETWPVLSFPGGEHVCTVGLENQLAS